MMINKDQYLLIVGAMKCGTSSIYNYLEEHPQICPATNKEPEYFSMAQGHGLPLKHYTDLWPQFDPAVHAYAMEASTGYTKFPVEKDVPERIQKAGILPRFIYIVRNPYERIVSHYNFMRQQHPVPLDLTNPIYISYSDYYLQLSQFHGFFDKERFLLLDFDDLKKDPKGLLDRIQEFAQIERGVYPESFDVVNSLQMPSPAETYLYKSKVKSLISVFPRAWKDWAKGLLRKAAPQKKRFLTEAEKELIHEKLSPGMKKLRDEYGFKVEKWGF